MEDLKNLQIDIVDNEDTKQKCLKILRSNDFIAVDTEFIRENLPKPLLCLLQIAAQQGNFVIDPFAVEVSFLKDIFSSENIVKVFHSADQDIEMLQLHGTNVTNIHDTQMYEMLLEPKESVSYQYIVNKYLGIKLKKNHSLSNWRKRPLSRNQLQYSIGDVYYLRAVYEKQLKALSDKGRVGWLEPEMQELAAARFSETHEACNIVDEVYWKLSEWIQNFSAQNNVPPESIVSNRIVKSISRKGNEFVKKIKNSRYAKNKHILQFLAFADEITQKYGIPRIKAQKDAVFYALRAILEDSSEKSHIAASLIATSSDLARIISGNREVRCLQGWRKEIFGNAALSFLEGKLSISRNDSIFTTNFTENADRQEKKI